MRVAGVIPAAGRSARMGEPKLLLELGGRRVLERLILALRQGGVEPVVVVTPGPGIAETEPIASLAAQAGAWIVRPDAQPAEMRDSIERGLARLGTEGISLAGVALCPGDSPGVTGELVARLLDRFRTRPDWIIQPEWSGRGRHPVILPWELALLIPTIPPGQGINALIAAHAGRRERLAWPVPAAPEDLDTPADLSAWRAVLEEGSGA